MAVSVPYSRLGLCVLEAVLCASISQLVPKVSPRRKTNTYRFFLPREWSQFHSKPGYRANLLTEDTGLFCRLPLATLSHWPKALRLGDRLRYQVRSSGMLSSYKVSLSNGFLSVPEPAPTKPPLGRLRLPRSCHFCRMTLLCKASPREEEKKALQG